jgi:predicted transcriptional regulator YdeE
MDTIKLNGPVNVIGFRVKTFPMGISEAFDRLTDMLGFDRPYYGLSQMSTDGVLYIAAGLKKSANEKSTLKLEEYTIPKGEYAVRVIKDWRRNLSAIPHVFGDLLKTEGIDDSVPCVEWYKNDEEMLCMVKLVNR